MRYRTPRHERCDDLPADDGRVLLVCRCGWVSPPVPAASWHLDDDAFDAAMQVHIAAWAVHYLPLITPSPFQVLDLRRDRWGGWRHYLAGEPVHAGAPLELLLPNSSWWAGRYESCWPPGSRDGGPTAMFYGPVGGPWVTNDTDTRIVIHFPLPADAVLRWPVREGGR